MLESYEFSVLMSLYCKEKPEYFEKALESVINQELKPSEIVIIKDGPLPIELNNVVDNFNFNNIEVKIIEFSENKGLGEALRVGIQECSHELVARMDTDDICKVDRFKKQIEKFKENTTLDVVGGLTDEFEEINSEVTIRGSRVVPENHKEIIKKLKMSNAFNHPTVMFKKNSVLLSGNYSEEFNCLEDYYLWIRMAVNNCKFYNIQESLIYFRITQGTSKRRGGLKMLIGDIKLHRRVMELGFISKTQMIKNVMVWSIYRLMPWKIREIVQKKIMRKK